MIVRYLTYPAAAVFLLLSAWLLLSLSGPDNLRVIEKDADFYYLEKNYIEAYRTYRHLDSLSPGNPLFLYRMGVCLLYVKGDKISALLQIEKGLKSNLASAEPDFYYNLARAYHLNYRFDEAVSMYNKYLSSDPKMPRILRDEISREITMCNNGKAMMRDSSNIIILNMEESVNSEYPDYAPIISPDESVLIFTSRRPGSKGGLRNVHGENDPHGEYFEDIFISRKVGGEWSKPVGVGDNVNTYGHDASVGASSDVRQLFIYKSDARLWGDIYQSTLTGDKWGVPVSLPEPINLPKSWEGSASLSADMNTLYFVSNRAGGYGERDIYKSVRQKGNTWSLPDNLGTSVNTPLDEEAPFITEDGLTLYFSSRGHNSMGGFDIFRSRIENGKWSQVENLGYPLNTPEDDIYFVLSGNGEHGYFSSSRSGTLGSQDIFIAFMTGKLPEDLVAQRFGKGGVRIVGGDINLPELQLKSGGDMGRMIKVVKPDGTTEIIPDTAVVVAVVASPDTGHTSVKPYTAAVIAFPVIYFEFDRFILTPDVVRELNDLVARMSADNNLQIEISGHACNIGASEYNYQLSLKRANAVAVYLRKKGVAAGMMKVQGKGEDQPAYPNDTPENRKKNRRVEMRSLRPA